MTSHPKPEPVPERYAAHVELLRAFFTSCGQRFGAPEDLFSLAVRLSTPGSFHADLSSLLRTVVYRENMQITRGELLDLVCSAIGGTESPSADLDVEVPTGQLLVFVNVVLLSMKKRPLETEQESPLSPPEAESAPPVLAAEVERAANFGVKPSLTSVESIFIATTIRPGHEAPAQQRSGNQSLSNPASESTPGSAQEPLFPEELRPPANPVFTPAPRRANVKNVGPLSRPAALVAALVLLLLAVVMFWPRHRAEIHQTKPAPDAVTAAGASVAKPSAYGAPASKPNVAAGGAGAPSSPTSAIFAGQQSSSASAGGAESATPSAEAIPLREETPGLPPDHGTRTPGPSTNGDTDVAPFMARRTGGIARDPFSVQHGGRKGLYTVSSGVMSGNLISAPSPEYPVLAKLTRVEGRVIMQAVVSRNGRVVATHVLQGHHLLRGAAEHAVRNWRYRPYIVNGRPTDVETIVFVDFRLHR